MIKATLWAEEGKIFCRTSFDKNEWSTMQGIVTQMKLEFNWKDRSWDGEKRIWKIDPSVAALFEQFLKNNGVEVTIMNQQIEVVTDSGDFASEFIAVCPLDILKETYRKACMSLHPDRGGTQEQMAQLNNSWTKIKEQKEKM